VTFTWPRIVIGVAALVVYYLVVVHVATKEYKPMSDRMSRALRTFVQAFLATAIPLVAAKLGDVKAATDLAGLPSFLFPVVVGALGSAASAAMHVLFPPKPEPTA
jgi:hypothetical protein